MFKVLVAEDEPKSRGALISRLRGILGDAALIEAASDGNDAVDKALRAVSYTHLDVYKRQDHADFFPCLPQLPCG